MLGRAVRRAPVVALAALAACGGPARTERAFEALERPARVELYTATGRGAEQVIEAVREAFARADREFGASPGGALARLNAEAAARNHAVESFDLYGCIKLALDWARASNGAFDPVRGADWTRVRLFNEARAIRFLEPTMRIDLDGIFEGCAVDVAARNFALAGTQAGLLALGPVQYAWMPPPGQAEWRVTLYDPSRPERAVGTVTTLNRAVAASGTFDPAPSEAAPDTVRGAVVIADTGADAQAISRALANMDVLRAGALLERTRRTEVLLLVATGEGPALLASGSLRERLEPEPDYLAAVGGRLRFILPPLRFP